MALMQIVTVPGVTAEQYDKVMELGQGGTLADGEIFHAAGQTDAGWCVLDAWESREQCEQNMQRLMPAFQQAGIDLSSMGPVQEFEVHNLMVRS